MVLLELLPHKSVLRITLDHHTCTPERVRSTYVLCQQAVTVTTTAVTADCENGNPVFAAPQSILLTSAGVPSSAHF